MTEPPAPWLRFFVEGEPVPQGSKKVWLNRKTGRPMMAEDQGIRHATWRREVAETARAAMQDRHQATLPARDTTNIGPLLTGPITIRLTFYMKRGLGHYGSGKNSTVVRASAPAYPDKAPDLDKLTRSILDSLTGTVWVDDGQVVTATIEKRWVDRWSGSPQGVRIIVGRQPEGGST